MQHLVYEFLTFSYFFAENYVTCKVTSAGETQKLTAKATICKPAVKLEIKNKVKEMSYGETVKFGTALVPTTSNDVVTWTSSDSKVATVDKNGKVKAVKEGKVTITATTLSGKTDSVTFNVYGGPDATPTPKPTAKPTQKPSKPVSNATYEQNFESDMGGWFDRGSTSAVQSGAASPAGGKYLEVTGRTSNWNGPGYEMMSVLKAGKEYKISAYVKQNTGDGEVIKLTSDKNAGTQYTGLANAATKKGEWTLLEGTLVVDTDTTSLVVYFEADNVTLDFMVDGIKIVDPNASAGGSTGTAKEEPKEEVKGTALDLSTAALISGDAPKVSGGKLTFTTNNNKCAFMLPAAVASGDKVTVAADFNFVALEPASVVRFYLINDSVDVALSDVAIISNADVSATAVQKTVTVTANGDANMLLMTNFAWDGSTPQAVTVNGISVQ